MLRVTNKPLILWATNEPFMLCFVMLNVALLSVILVSVAAPQASLGLKWQAVTKAACFWAAIVITAIKCFTLQAYCNRLYAFLSSILQSYFSSSLTLHQNKLECLPLLILY
jgi:hypothetical protein